MYMYSVIEFIMGIIPYLLTIFIMGTGDENNKFFLTKYTRSMVVASYIKKWNLANSNLTNQKTLLIRTLLGTLFNDI